MNKIKLDLENCYGIGKLNYELDFSNKNIIVIYAANGTMKTSFANTFRDISNKKQPIDRIYNLPSKCRILDENDVDINPEDIVVVNPFEESLTVDQAKLMVNQELQNEYVFLHEELNNAKNQLFNKIKTQLKYAPQAKFNPEAELSIDYGKSEKEIYDTLKKIREIINKEPKAGFKIEDVSHSVLFTPQAIKFYNNNENHKLLQQYSKKYEELIENSEFLVKGVFDHNNFIKVVEGLKHNGFFDAHHEVIVNTKSKAKAMGSIKTEKELYQLIDDEKARILNDVEIKTLFEKISAEIIANKETLALDKYLRDNPQFTVELENIERFKRRIWVEVLRNNQMQLNQLIELYESTYSELSAIIEIAREQETRWHLVIKVFGDRFYAPFVIKPTNLDDVILQNDVPAFEYKYSKEGGRETEIEHDRLLELLSTGEKRAYYLLNLIYQTEIRRIENRPGVLVLDDIADSFDYRNKYAIIEYINDIANMKDIIGNDLFNIIVLTHNFDFYRTVGSRIAEGKNCYIVNVVNGSVQFKGNSYLKNYFSYVRDQCMTGSKIFIVAAIPFVRNLIEYTYSENDTQYCDYFLLTSLLHLKGDTENITISDLQRVYNMHWLNGNANFSSIGAKPVVEVIYEVAEEIINSPELYNSIDIENKIVLSIAIRLKAEELMISQIKSHVKKGNEIICKVQSEGGQTIKLYNEYKKHAGSFSKCYESQLQKVVMMTPENIHINSFMYEPIVDMHGDHLQKLYSELKVITANSNEV
ncbi:MAG: hypothetical protein WC231_00060 [Dehalococcoidales bacterium]